MWQLKINVLLTDKRPTLHWTNTDYTWLTQPAPLQYITMSKIRTFAAKFISRIFSHNNIFIVHTIIKSASLIIHDAKPPFTAVAEAHSYEVQMIIETVSLLTPFLRKFCH